MEYVSIGMWIKVNYGEDNNQSIEGQLVHIVTVDDGSKLYFVREDSGEVKIFAEDYVICED